jgi:hypothetical protein
MAIAVTIATVARPARPSLFILLIIKSSPSSVAT